MRKTNDAKTGLLLALALMLLTAGIRYGRVGLLMEGTAPAVSVSNSDRIWVELADGFPEPGIHQFIDGVTPRGVIQVTLGVDGRSRCVNISLDRPLVSGESLCVQMKDTEIIEIKRKWMSASRRMVLGIPLRPQTMTGDDWMAIPGIGPKLATSIELDRQKNGEFTSFSQLARVSGIGPGRLAAWEKYFKK